MTLLAIDPGRSYKGTGKARQTIGYCIFDEANGKAYAKGQLSWEELTTRLTLELVEDHKYCEPPCPDFTLWVDGWFVSEVVIEDFVNDPQSARGGQRNGTSECIGAVEILANIAQVPFTRQPSSDLGPAKLHAGYVQKLKHLPHQDSAYLHGFEYLVKKGVLKPVGLEATL